MMARRGRATPADALEASPSSISPGVSKGLALQDEFSVPAADLPFEFMMNALRLIEGLRSRAVRGHARRSRCVPSKRSCVRQKTRG